MRAITLAGVSFLLLNACAGKSPEYAVHPVPTEPKFLAAARYEEFKAKVAAPPATGSGPQAADEKALLDYQRERRPEDCARAESEVQLSLNNFYGGPRGPLRPAEVASLERFFGQLRNDADYYIQRLKVDFPRPRPFLYVKGLEPCIPREKTQAYPSGHAAIAQLQARVLASLFPERAEAFLERARVIGRDRVLAGVHHPSDVAAGQALADQIYDALKKSAAYRAALAEAKAK